MIRKSFLTLLLLFSLCVRAYTPLDSEHPVHFLGDAVLYGDEIIVPGPRCFFIDGSLTDAQAALNPWVFNDFNEAAACFTDGTPDDPMRVLIAPWVYWIDDPDDPEVRVGKEGREPFGLVIRCNNLHIVGLNPDPRNVVIAAARGQTQGAVGNFTMLDIWGDGLQVKNLTFGNYCNVDLDFPLNPSLSRKKRNEAITQAHVAYCHGDRVYAENVHFISRLNMNPLNGARRILFNRCHMEMTDDALTGTGVYLHCSLDFYGARPFWATHANGAVFLDCDFNMCQHNDRVFFCKGVGQVTAVDCRINSDHPLYFGWTNYPPDWLRCYIYNVSLCGQPYFIGAEKSFNTVDMSLLPLLDAYRVIRDDSIVYNTYNLLCGDDGWDPLGVKPLIGEAYDIPTSLVVTPRESTLRTGDQPVEIRASLFRHTGYLMPTCDIAWSVQPGMERYVKLIERDSVCTVESLCDTEDTVHCIITASNPDGLQGAVALTLLPSELPAPEFVEKPSLHTTKGYAEIKYLLGLDGRNDESLITWYRCKDASGAQAIPVAVSRHDKPLYIYPLTPDDCGYYLMAEIRPKSPRSQPGLPHRVISRKKISKSQVSSSDVLTTDFFTFPTEIQKEVIPGFWTVDCYKPGDTDGYDWTPDPSRPSWKYDKGFNGAVGYGLLQEQRGARLMYLPSEKYKGDMEVALTVDPTKTAGQGFGSATGQYMDICIKFDPYTLTGYALRIERTTKSSKAVDFSLVRYDRGKVTPLTEPVTAVCYRTGCHINIKTEGPQLYAQVYTDTPLEKDTTGYARTVDLNATITPTPHSGFAIQHTGSCGESTTMLHRLTLKYLK